MLQLGSKGPEVKNLQEKLIIRGYSVGSYGADGDFGQGTHDAVVRFQRDHGLDADGIVGPATMKAIDGSIGTTLLRKGDRGPAVKELQQKLIAKGYSVGAYGADGDFGQGTFDAVVRFQSANGLDADGIVGVATWGALNGFSNGKLLKFGDRGAEVKSLQEKLIAKGYSVGAYGADGDFGQGTHDAVVRFQKANGLSADGIVGPATWEVLNGFNGNSILKLGDRGPAVKELQEKLITRGYSVGAYGADGDFGQGTYDAVVRFQRDNGLDADGVVGSKTMYALNANPSGSLLKLGSKGAEVRNLQERLISRGYSVGPYGADGDFGQGTHDAVVRFQRDSGLGADGVVGPATWAALGTNNTLLRLGSKGSEVKRLQEALIKKGYSVGPYGADGDFGQGTHDAVVKFQKANGLYPDGVVGPATWSALNGFNDWNPGVGGTIGVKKFLNVAKSQLGVREIPINITPYGAWYGMNGVAWCAIFVSWCANQAGIMGSSVPKFHWCADGVNWFKARGRYMVRGAGTPESGDVIFFYNSKEGFYHVGIVNYVSNGRVYTIEGNTSTDDVAERSYGLSETRIHGYGRNGGIQVEPDKEGILKKAGNVGLFKGEKIIFGGFNMEVPLGVISLIPFISLSGKISHVKGVQGKEFEIGTDNNKDLAATFTNGLIASGITLGFNEKNVLGVIKGIGIGLTDGDRITYRVDILPGLIPVIEVSFQYKLPIDGHIVYQIYSLKISQPNPFSNFKTGMPVVQGEKLTEARKMSVSEAVSSLMLLAGLAFGGVAIYKGVKIFGYFLYPIVVG
ncbi:MAG: peptidoglycan-binding protein [Sarcina sp.]